MKRFFVLVTFFLFLFFICLWEASANEYIKKTPSAYTYKDIYDDIYLMLDQSTPQTVNNGRPVFQDGLGLSDGNTYFVPVGTDTLTLYVDSTLVHTWSVTAGIEFLLLEDGVSFVLLEDGLSKILLE